MSLRPNRKVPWTLPDDRAVEIGGIDHVFREWTGESLSPTKFNYEPPVELDGHGFFAELAIARLYHQEGWNAVWASTYAGFHYFDEHPLYDNSNATTVPDHVEAAVEKIAEANGGKRAGMFDVIAWRDGEFRFTEAKRSKRTTSGTLSAAGSPPRSMPDSNWTISPCSSGVTKPDSRVPAFGRKPTRLA